MTDAFTDKLSDYLDDELGEPERAAVQAHLARCAACSDVLDDLRRVVATAATLPPQPPASDLWTGIAARTSQRARWQLSFSLPEAVAATLLIALLSGGLVWWLRSQPAPRGTQTAAQTVHVSKPDRYEQPVVAAPVALGDAQYDAAVRDLQTALERGRGRLDPATVAAIEQSVAAIDRALAQAEQALERDPANAYVTGHLLETRRRKLDLLRRAAELTTEMN